MMQFVFPCALDPEGSTVRTELRIAQDPDGRVVFSIATVSGGEDVELAREVHLSQDTASKAAELVRRMTAPDQPDPNHVVAGCATILAILAVLIAVVEHFI